MKKNLVMKQFLTLIIIMTLIISSGVMAAAADMSFSDVKTSDWHYATTTKVVDKGIMKGYPGDLFKPQNSITKAEFITTVVKIVTGGDVPADGDFWARAYIEKARELGITDIEVGSADDSIDTWNKAITRQEMAEMISKAILINEDSVDITQYRTAFNDYSAISNSYKDYVLQAYGKGIISGYGDGTFGPVRTATRAEAGVMLVRLDDPSQRIDMSKVQNIDGIMFNPETDIRPDGMMTEAAAMRFLDKTLTTIKFYKEGGKYYVTGTLPELPEGFTNGFGINVVFKSKPGFNITTGFTMSEKAKISSTGTFTKEITGMTSVSDINYVDVMLSIDNANGDAYVGYAFGEDRNRLFINYYVSNSGTGRDYDVSRNFQW